MKYLLEGQETERILFRKIKASDFNEWLEFFKNSDTSKYWISDSDTPEIECKKWYEKQFNRYENDLGGMNALIEKETGSLIGHCGLLIQIVDSKKEMEIGYSLLPKFWNKGFATEAAKKCKDFVFNNNLRNTLISIISLTNKQSERVAIKNGMRIDEATTYNKNEVNIYRIYKSEWNK